MATEPRTVPDAAQLADVPELIDSHVHVACDGAARNGAARSVGASEWWRTGGSEDQVQATLRSHGVQRAVVVQAVGLYGYDCACASQVVARSDGRDALVAAIDMDRHDLDEQLAGLGALGRVAGLRLFGVGAEPPPWLHDGRAASVFSWAGDSGVALVPTLFARDLEQLGRLAAAAGEVQVVLDHCAFPDLAGDEGPLLALGALPNVSTKVTTHNLDRDDAEALGLVERLVAAFGAERLLWGSDHPQHMSCSYARMLELAASATRTLDDVQRAQFFGVNARRRFWGERA